MKTKLYFVLSCDNILGQTSLESEVKNKVKEVDVIFRYITISNFLKSFQSLCFFEKRGRRNRKLKVELK